VGGAQVRADAREGLEGLRELAEAMRRVEAMLARLAPPAGSPPAAGEAGAVAAALPPPAASAAAIHGGSSRKMVGGPRACGR
jgi:hypothetical protein